MTTRSNQPRDYYCFEPGEFGRPYVTDPNERRQSICLGCEFGANASNDWGLCPDHFRARHARKEKSEK